MFRIILCLSVSLNVFLAGAQTGWNWPDPETEKEKYDLAREKWVFSDDRINERISSPKKEAVPAIEWLLENTPDLNLALYINASKLYEELVSAETDPQQKRNYQEAALNVYDLRISHFGNEADVLNKKGLKAWFYLHQDPQQLDKLFRLYKKIVALNGDDTYALNVFAYMDLVCAQYNEKAITNEEALAIYEELSGIIRTNLETGEDTATWEAIKEKVEAKMLNCLQLSCEYVASAYGADFQKNPDTEKAKLVFGLLLKGKCIRDSLFSEVAMYLFEKNPDESLASAIARSCQLRQDDACALRFYEEAAKLSSDPGKAAAAFYQMAHTYRKQGKKQQARTYALKAAKSDPSDNTAYEFIGDLYFNSFDDCATDNELESKAVFLAAYEMYEKAGAKEKMEKVQQGFPTTKTIFQYGKKEGEKISTGCWINETVTIRKRP